MADIRHAIQTAASAEQIFPLVSTGEGLGEWWATDITEPGETVDLGFFGRSTVYRLRLISQNSPTRVEWVCESGDEWKGTHLVFEMETGKSGAILRFSHAGWGTESPYFIFCNTTWGALMFRLKEAAEGRKAGPLFTNDGLQY
jgi:hypothetical protein